MRSILLYLLPLSVAAAALAGQPVRTNQQGIDFKPPAAREQWLRRRSDLRTQILVAAGLHPMLPRTPLNARVYDRKNAGDYSVEKVVLETLPGYFVSGNLYRPAGGMGRVPGILNPHGHWPKGRMEPDLQARCAGQARMGAVAFMYDMIGYADSAPFGHSFTNDRLQALGFSLSGLQLWNSIRALDWLVSLPDVDPNRIACTGESGGGTQTFLLAAVDDRIAVSAPVCMVSDHFQGGCQCENAPTLRVGADNVEIAAMVAPRPQILIGATGDWSSRIMEKGVPEIRGVYRLFDAEDRLDAVVHEAPHNYNLRSRESVYSFLRRHLWQRADEAPVREAAFTPRTAEELTTWTPDHPRPAGAATPASLEHYLEEVARQQAAALAPSAASWSRSRDLIRDNLRHRLGLASVENEPVSAAAREVSPGEFMVELARPRMQRSSRIQVRLPRGRPSGALVLALPAEEESERQPDISQALLSKARAHGLAVVLAAPSPQALPAAARDRQRSSFFTTYNRTALAEQVIDILDAVQYARQYGPVRLAGLGQAGPAAMLAAPFAGGLHRFAADAAGWEWPDAMPVTHPAMLPGVHRTGGMRSFAALLAGQPGLIHNHGLGPDVSWLRAARREGAHGEPALLSRTAAADEVAAALGI